MKTVDYYMELPYRMEIIPDKEEGGFIATFPDLPGCITVGDTIEAVGGAFEVWKGGKIYDISGIIK